MIKNSIVEYSAEHESYRCGYCKSPDTNFSHGMWAHMLTVTDYQDLIDRGWRRSGKYCYKPTMDVTCCPMYTIRCRALEFKPSKSQKKVLKRFNKFLSGQEMCEPGGDAARKMSCGSATDGTEEGRGEQFVECTKGHQEIDIADVVNNYGQDVEVNARKENTEMVVMTTLENETSNKQANVLKVSGPDPTKAPCKKAKLLRLERRLEKLKEKGVDVSTMTNNTCKNQEKQIEDFINELPEEFKRRLEMKLVRTAPPSPQYNATAKKTHEIYVKYQTIIHGDKPDKCAEPKFREFLVTSPLIEETSETGPPCGYGSFHQQYWLDGKLIAVGVIDILPRCVSSVYFFYDPQYMNLTPGTYGALREIAFTRHLHTLCPELKYYYMGFYIHSCRKMRYKGNFYPSDLVCPETFQWIPMNECLPKLDKSPYSRLHPDLDAVDDNYPKEDEINYIPILVKSAVVPYKVYKRKYGNKRNDSEDELKEYARLVGAKAAKSIVLVK